MEEGGSFIGAKMSSEGHTEVELLNRSVNLSETTY